MRVIIACAGTGGHINPAIAIANIILKNRPDANILFVGTKTGLENELVKNAGFKLEHIKTGKIIRSFTLKNFKALFDTYNGICEAKRIVKEFVPDIVIGTGGYICVPVMLAAKKYKIPYILHESNAFPGVSVKLLAKSAACVMVGFSDTKNRLKYKENVVYTGTPAKFGKDDIKKLDKENCKKELGLDKINQKIIFVTGGSQGAKKFNQVILDMLKKHLNDNIYIILVTGSKNYDEIITCKKKLEEELGKSLNNYIKIEKFIFDMPKMYKVADMCITRAGAMTVTELTLSGKPAILIPLPTAAENHQLYNAKVLGSAHAGVVIEQKDLNEDILCDKINTMLDDKNLKMMSENANKLVINGVETKIYKCILDSIKK